jgi:hypothetical protein
MNSSNDGHISRGTQTDEPEPSLPEEPEDLPQQGGEHDDIADPGTPNMEATLDAGMAAQNAAEAVISDAMSLVASLQDLSHDSMISFSAVPPNQGDQNLLIPYLTQSSNSFECLPVDPLPPLEINSHVPDPFHVREIQRRRARTKRAHDAAAKLHRSHRLAAKEESNFLDMLEKVVRKKAARFDLSAATASLSAALNATGLVDAPDLPTVNPLPLVAVAAECGVDTDDAAELFASEVPAGAP